jgi:hypothetical protein
MKSTIVIVTIFALLIILNWISSGNKSERKKNSITSKQKVEDFNNDIIESYTLDKCNTEDTNHQGNCLKCNAEVFNK